MFSHHYDYNNYVWFFTWAYIPMFFPYGFFNLTFLIIYSHILLISIISLLNRSLKSKICADSLRWLIHLCSSHSIIVTLSHKGSWFPFFFHIWSAIPDFSISPRITAFRYSSNIIFGRQHVSPLYALQSWMKYTVLDHIEFCWWLDTEKIPPESWATCEYCPDVVWTTYTLDPVG